jgi:L-asparagine oxygenase
MCDANDYGSAFRMAERENVMQKTHVYVKRFTDEQKHILADRLTEIEYPKYRYASYLRAIRRIRADVAGMFTDIERLVEMSRSEPSFPAAIKFENLPVSDSVPMPPVENSLLKRIDKSDYLSENLLLLIATLFGEPYSMECEGRGLVNNLIPSRSTSAQFTGLGAASDLGYHIENAALRFLVPFDCSPKALFLTGVRQDEKPPYTRLADARLALMLLDPCDIEQLASPSYRLRLPYRWRGFRPGYDTLLTNPLPLIELIGEHLMVHAAFYGDMIGEVRSAAAQRAADHFEEALEAVGIDEVVAPGEVLGIDNRVTLHARTPFPASFDGQGRAFRWVQRTFVTERIINFRDWDRSDDRVFAANFVGEEVGPVPDNGVLSAPASA